MAKGRDAGVRLLNVVLLVVDRRTTATFEVVAEPDEPRLVVLEELTARVGFGLAMAGAPKTFEADEAS